MSSRVSANAQAQRDGRARESFWLYLVVAMALVASLAASGCAAKPTETAPEPAKTEEAQPAEVPPAAAPQGEVTELKIEDTKIGTGAEAKTGDLVTVNYTGYLTDGTKFDSSLDSGKPFQFRIGEGRVIQGWEQGFAGMKEGGTRKLTIPPALGYGAQGKRVIPPNATLVFEVELVKVN